MRTAMAAVVLVAACGHGVPADPDSATPRSALVKLRVQGAGSVRAAELSVDCRQSCDTTVQPGTSVHLTAIADTAATFRGWQGGCSGISECDLTITGDVMVTAEFKPSDPCAESRQRHWALRLRRPWRRQLRTGTAPAPRATDKVTWLISSPAGAFQTGSCTAPKEPRRRSSGRRI